MSGGGTENSCCTPCLVDVHRAQLVGVGRAIPDEIVAAVTGPQVVVEASDRVGDDLLARRQIEHEVREDLLERLRREVGFIRRSAPDVVAGIDRLQLRRDLSAHGRADAVAADQDVGVFDTAAIEMHAHAAAVLFDALERPAEMVVRRVDGLAQQPLQPIPGCQDLPQRALAGDAPLAIDGDPFRYLDAELAGAGAACLQHRQQFRMRGDTGAAPDQFDRRALVDVGLPADLTQECGAEQPRHRAADDDGAPRFAA